MKDLIEYLKGSSEVRKLLLIGNSKLDGLKKSQVIRINERKVTDPYKAIENSKTFLINFFKSKKLISPKSQSFFMKKEVSLDIDTNFDLKLANFMTK